MPILFCHGLEGGPTGRKVLALRDAGLDVLAPDGRGLDLSERAAALLAALLRAPTPLVVVGSSFGGLAGLLAAQAAAARGVRIPALVLLAPALHLPLPPGAPPLRPPAPTAVLHGRRDPIIPIDVSRAFAAAHGADLREVDDDHALARSLPEIVALVREAAARA